MESWPEFVTETEEPERSILKEAALTGWETVVFEVEEAQDGSDFPTAALAP